jgi:type IV pilus assembly protein PilA
VELLAVLAMISIMSVLAVSGYRKYLSASKSSEAKTVIGAIRIAEESQRAETLSYLSCSGTLTNWYPATPNGKKRHWLNNANAEFNCWRMLNVVTDTFTRYGFTVVAGAPGDVMPVPSTVNSPGWPTPTEPWYVVQAAGDNDNDGSMSLFLSSSINGEIYVEEPEE